MLSEIMVDDKGVQCLAQLLIMMILKQIFENAKVNKTNQIKAHRRARFG